MNKILTKNLILFTLSFFIFSCNVDSGDIKLPNDIRWVVKSPEYKILCEQIYNTAWGKLSRILKNSDSKSCIVMDLDETVLDNSKYQIDLTKKGESYNPESWSEWVNLKEADLVPGAKKFIDNVKKTNVRIVFLSNRMDKNKMPTIENMENLSIVDENDIFLLRIDKEDKKYIRRSEIINGNGRLSEIGPLKVLAYFGDAKHDFPENDGNFTFGQNMFMFPNPMYGKW